MKALSVQLVTNVAQMVTADDREEIFDALGRVLSVRRGRPVILKRAAFPPNTASGLWLDRQDLDILAVREDAASAEHELVILGHEIWHMMEGHCVAHTQAGPAAARGHSTRLDAVEHVIALLLASPDERLGDMAHSDLAYAARTDFEAAVEEEAERFGLEFATEMRSFLRTLRRRDPLQVTWRIERSLRQGPRT